NKRYVTKGSYLEERTPIATIADLSRIRLVGYVPETAAPVVRDLVAAQDDRLLAARIGLALGGIGHTSHALQRAVTLNAVASDIIPSGYDPEFQILALPGQSFLAR